MEEVKLLKIDGGYVYAPEKYWNFEECEPETYYVFKEGELDEHGKMYLNMLRIVQDRALQQVEKSRVDEHGYRLIRAQKKKHAGNREAWLIKKATPYSIKIDLKSAGALISKDIVDYYHGIYEELKHWHGIYDGELLDWYRYGWLTYKRDFEHNQAAKCGFLDRLDALGIDDGKMVLEITEISGNIGTGTYEVTYWANDQI